MAPGHVPLPTAHGLQMILLSSLPSDTGAVLAAENAVGTVVDTAAGCCHSALEYHWHVARAPALAATVPLTSVTVFHEDWEQVVVNTAAAAVAAAAL